MLSQSSGIKVYQGVYRGSPVVVRVRLAHVADPGRPLATLRVACVGGLAQPVSVDWRSRCWQESQCFANAGFVLQVFL